ncbi:hypothetical protein K0U07_00230 [bacterium]|nr:hypothetical protein [bacterium]
MIIKDISHKKWRKGALQFVHIFSFISLVCTIFLLLGNFFSPSLPLSQKNAALNTSLIAGKKEDFLWKKHDKTPTLPSPPIETAIFYGGANFRPDKKDNTIALSSEGHKIIAKLHEPIYFSTTGKDILFSEEDTPFCITPIRATKNELQVTLTTTYRGKNGKVIYKKSTPKTLSKKEGKHSPVSTASANACKSLSKTQFLGPDTLLSIYGDKKDAAIKNCSRLLFKNNSKAKCFPIKKGDLFHFIDGNWVITKEPAKDAPLFVITSLSKKALKGTFWNESGFFSKDYTIPFTRRTTNNIHTFSFDKVYRRNSDSVICTIKDRTFLLKQNDWLIKKNASWHNLKKLSELNHILDLQTATEIIIFEDIIKEKDREVFIGYIFDKTRSNYKKLQIPLKKKEIVRYTK